MVSAKSRLALKWSVCNLFRASKRAYFWTFTFADNRRSEAECKAQFAGFWDALRKVWGPSGVRVWERGDSGGHLHLHAVIDCRIPVAWVRRVGARWGVGRVQVCQVRRGKLERLANYLAAYMGKSSGEISGRRWSAFGIRTCAGFRPTRIKDVEVTSPSLERTRKLFEAVKQGLGGESLSGFEAWQKARQIDVLWACGRWFGWHPDMDEIEQPF